MRQYKYCNDQGCPFGPEFQTDMTTTLPKTIERLGSRHFTDANGEDLFIDDILAHKSIEERLPKGWQQLVLESVRSGKGMVYVLALEEGKYYVGWTGDILRRIGEHFDGRGARWTRLYPPISVLLIKIGGVELETRIARECRAHWGSANVRGGPWCEVEEGQGEVPGAGQSAINRRSCLDHPQPKRRRRRCPV